MYLRLSDGRYALRFEDFQMTNGPDVFHYLTSPGGVCDPCSTQEVEGDGAVLKLQCGSNADADGRAVKRGNFNTVLPGGIKPLDFTHVVQWCDAFDVQFGVCGPMS